ncbi:MAG: hypothetical protein AAF665_19725 [Pseudomonadota bacterium]
MRRALLIWSLIFAAPAQAEYRLDLVDTGKRDYYCTITVSLTNEGGAQLTELNVFFLNFIGNEQVGRSKGASFMNVSPGASVEATFETPNAPCNDVETYHPIVGACRLGSSFEEKQVCVDRLDLTMPFKAATALN